MIIRLMIRMNMFQAVVRSCDKAFSKTWAPSDKESLLEWLLDNVNFDEGSSLSTPFWLSLVVDSCLTILITSCNPCFAIKPIWPSSDFSRIGPKILMTSYNIFWTESKPWRYVWVLIFIRIQLYCTIRIRAPCNAHRRYARISEGPGHKTEAMESKCSQYSTFFSSSS